MSNTVTPTIPAVVSSSDPTVALVAVQVSSIMASVCSNFKNHTWTATNVLTTIQAMWTTIDETLEIVDSNTKLQVFTNIITLILDNSGLPGVLVADIIKNLPAIVQCSEAVCAELLKGIEAAFEECEEETVRCWGWCKSKCKKSTPASK